MPKWTQSSELGSPTQEVEEVVTAAPEAPAEEPVEEAKGFKKFLSKKYAAVGMVVCIIVGIAAVIGLILWQQYADRAMKTPGDTPDDIIAGDPANIDDFFSSFDPVFAYTQEEIADLRAWGYTGPEIEEAQSNETPASELIAASKKAQEEARETLSNPWSPEYLALLSQTWLGERAVEVPEFIVNYTGYSTENITFNADYERMPAHGTNLFLRILLADGTHHFMEVSPFRYSELDDAGNIVVTYDLITLDGVQFINNMREKEVR